MNEQLELSIVEKIESTYREATTLAAFAAKKGKEAILKARECGQYLIEARENAPHKKLKPWLMSHVTFMNYETACRWVRLAETPLEELENSLSVRQAYIAAGILPESKNTTSGATNRDPDGTNWIGVLDRLTISVEKIFDSRPVSTWQESERNMFIERARPMVRRFVEAGGSLSA